MPPTLAHRLKVFLLAWVLAIVSASAALAAEPAGAPTLMGLTRAQVFTRLGRPKSQIVAGNRVVMFFDKERLVLRDGIVIEEEQLSSEPSARRPPALAAFAARLPAAWLTNQRWVRRGAARCCWAGWRTRWA